LGEAALLAELPQAVAEELSFGLRDLRHHA
jgi:hypothetical protein